MLHSKRTGWELSGWNTSLFGKGKNRSKASDTPLPPGKFPSSSRAKAKHIKFIKKRDGRGIRLNFYLANLSTNILKGTRHILGWERRHYKIRDKNISCIWDASPHLCREMERFPFRTQKERWEDWETRKVKDIDVDGSCRGTRGVDKRVIFKERR